MHSPIKTRQLTMDFPAAIKAIIDGRKVTKLEWNDINTFGVLKDGILMIHRDRPTGKLTSELACDYGFHQWIISQGDLLGTDWIVVLDN